MKEKLNPENDIFDPTEDYFKKKDISLESDNEEYFPLEFSKPPHY